MVFNWMIAVIVAIMAYACFYYWLKTKKNLPKCIDFSGPFILIKSHRVGIFDRLARWKKLLIGYATVGIVLTVLSGLIMTLMIVVSALLTLTVDPEPVAVQNMLLIPGLNQYIPSTVAVWVSLVLALIIHEGGHGVLSRAENIRVKSTGLLTCVVPLGAFVEPDEEDLEKSPLKTKLRMFAAGITNNLIFGIICLIVLALLLGMVVPGDHIFASGIYADSPAEHAGLLPGTLIYSINDVPITTLADVSTVLNGTVAGDVVRVSGSYHGEAAEYDILLSAIPESYASAVMSNASAGFMGISFSNPATVKTLLDSLIRPSSPGELMTSFIYFLVLPFKSLAGLEVFGFVTADSPDESILAAPFFGYWSLIHFLFWSAWINIMLGTFNALPIRSFDGGQMVREVLRSICRKYHKDEARAYQLTGILSLSIIFLLVFCLVIPYLF